MTIWPKIRVLLNLFLLFVDNYSTKIRVHSYSLIYSFLNCANISYAIFMAALPSYFIRYIHGYMKPTPEVSNDGTELGKIFSTHADGESSKLSQLKTYYKTRNTGTRNYVTRSAGGTPEHWRKHRNSGGTPEHWWNNGTLTEQSNTMEQWNMERAAQ